MRGQPRLRGAVDCLGLDLGSWIQKPSAIATPPFRPLRTQRITNGSCRISAFLSAVNNAIREPCAEASIRSGGPVSPCHKQLLGRGCWRRPSSVRAWRSSAARWSTWRCRRCRSGLTATVIDVQWVMETYAFLLSALLLVGGSLGDRFGRRRVFISAFALCPGFGLVRARIPESAPLWRGRPRGWGLRCWSLAASPLSVALSRGRSRMGDRGMVWLYRDHRRYWAGHWWLADRAPLLARGLFH